MNQLYDEKGVPIKDGDMIRVYHFRTPGKKYYMYKRVFVLDGHFMAEHYPFTGVNSLNNSYRLKYRDFDKSRVDGVIVVASDKHDHDDRKKAR